MGIREGLSFLLDFVFPRICESCGNPVEHGCGTVCRACRKRYVAECFEHCPTCGKTAQSCICVGGFTDATRTSLGGRRSLTLTFYRPENTFGASDRVTEKLIFALKENGRCADFFADELARAVLTLMKTAEEDVSGWILTSPPRSVKNRMKYGFDQGELLGEALAKRLGIPYRRTMLRGGRSEEQKRLSSAQRQANAESTLVPMKRSIAEGGRYLLVDDIVTSGATVCAAAKLLYENGASAVFPLSIAKTENRRK